MKRKLFIFLGFILLFLICLFVFKTPIMKGMANFLIAENEANHTLNYGFVLSGGAFDRGNKAASLYKEGKILQFMCTGKNQSPDLKALGTDTLESDLTKLQMVKQGVPDSLIYLLKEGTSTLEESEAILVYCKTNNIKEIGVISSKFHTKRVHQVFTKKFKKEGIEVFIYGAPSSMYNEMEWWQNEYGLIALNNEYIKQLYYLVKYRE
ncbi:MAG: YdcF family protein [Chitinophagales bacterium]